MVQWYAIVCECGQESARATKLQIGANVIRVGNEEVRVDINTTSPLRISSVTSGYLEGNEILLDSAECFPGSVISFSESALTIIAGEFDVVSPAESWLAVHDPRTGLSNRNHIKEYAGILTKRGEQTYLVALLPKVIHGTFADLAILGWTTKRLVNQDEHVGTIGGCVIVLANNKEQRPEKLRRSLLEDQDVNVSSSLASRGIVIPMRPDFHSAELIMNQVISETRGTWVRVDE